MVEISLSGSGEGPGKVTTRGYSTGQNIRAAFQAFLKRCPVFLSRVSTSVQAS
jgi:hypothetical protein